MAADPSLHLVFSSGSTFEQLRAARRSGELEPLRRGAYLAGAGPARAASTDEWDYRRSLLRARCMAVEAALRCRFAFSHATAAFLHGWPTPLRDTVEVIHEFRPGSGGSADIVRHRAALPEHDLTSIGGLPVTTPERTVLDCVLTLSPPDGLAVADAGLRQLAAVDRRDREGSIARQDEVRAHLLDQLAQRGSVRHVRRARAVLAAADGLAESAGESWTRWVGLCGGLPAPELQVPIDTAEGLRFPDLLWRFAGGALVIAEYDGAGTYGREALAVFRQERRREEALRARLGSVSIAGFWAEHQRDPRAAFTRLLQECPAQARGALEPRLDLRATRYR